MMQGVREQELRLTQEEALKFVIFPSSPPLHYPKNVAPSGYFPQPHRLLPSFLCFLNLSTYHSRIAQVLGKIIICVLSLYWKCEFLEAKRPILKSMYL